MRARVCWQRCADANLNKKSLVMITKISAAAWQSLAPEQRLNFLWRDDVWSATVTTW
jgi:hypothetical protein